MDSSSRVWAPCLFLGEAVDVGLPCGCHLCQMWLKESTPSHSQAASSGAAAAALPATNEAAHVDTGGGGEALDVDTAVYCLVCKMWLNGVTQWLDHQGGKKHKKNKRRQDLDDPDAQGEGNC